MKRDEVLARNAVDGVNVFRFLIQDGCLNSPRQFQTVNDGLFVPSDLKPEKTALSITINVRVDIRASPDTMRGVNGCQDDRTELIGRSLSSYSRHGAISMCCNNSRGRNDRNTRNHDLSRRRRCYDNRRRSNDCRRGDSDNRRRYHDRRRNNDWRYNVCCRRRHDDCS